MITIKLEHGEADFVEARLRYFNNVSAVLDPSTWIDRYGSAFRPAPILSSHRYDESGFWQLDAGNNWWGKCYHNNDGWFFSFHCRFWEREAVVAPWMAHVLRGDLIEESPVEQKEPETPESWTLANNAINALKEAVGHDREQAHLSADAILCDLLQSLGYGAVVKEYNKIEKWYA